MAAVAATILNCAANKILVDSFFFLKIYTFLMGLCLGVEQLDFRVCIHNEIYPVFSSGCVELHSH